MEQYVHPDEENVGLAEVSYEEMELYKKQIAQNIYEELMKEFKNLHLSGNILAAIKIYQNEEKWVVEVAPEMYDISKWKATGVIIHTKPQSYAKQVNKTGGFSGGHKDYIRECINRAILKWCDTMTYEPHVVSTLYDD